MVNPVLEISYVKEVNEIVHTELQSNVFLSKCASVGVLIAAFLSETTSTEPVWRTWAVARTISMLVIRRVATPGVGLHVQAGASTSS